MNDGTLVIAEQRELRRRLFDALDRVSDAPIHSARGMSHAAILLEGRPVLQLMVIVLEGDAEQAQASVDRLRCLTGTGEVPLIAILTPESMLEPVDLPAGVIGCLHEGQIEDELPALCRRWLDRLGSPVAPAPAPDANAACENLFDGYRGLLDDGVREWMIVAKDTLCIVDVSPALLRNSRLPADHWCGLALAEALHFKDAAVAAVAGRGDGQWQPCRRQSKQGADAGQASVRPMRYAGQPAMAIVFRADRADLSAESALKLLSQVFAARGATDASDGVAQLLFDALELDYLALWPARRDGADAAAPLLQLCRGEEPSWPPPSAQGSLQKVLAGKSIRCRADAQRLASIDPLLKELALTGFVGLPLVDERQTVVGAMLAGTRQGFGPLQIVEPLFNCAAARFAQVMALRRAREQDRAEALVDTLTGLPNQLLFSDRLDTIIREANRNGECFALLFVDLDRFEDVNKGHGHAAGDHVLRTVTQRLCSSIRASDTVARYAGDEFTAVLRHIVKNDDVERVAEKILQTMEKPLYLEDGTELTTTVSMGLSFFPDDATDAQTLLKHADAAMYAAKDQGRNNVQIYQISPEQARQQGTALRSRLRLAEGNDELRVVYQPQVNAVSEDIVGMEALVRWEHPELGLISPATFIPLAEETGLIVSIGEWVMRTACAQARQWEQDYGLRLRLGVNLSAVQLMEPSLVDTVSRALRDTGLDPHLLELEITESVSIKAAPNLVENLQALHRLGCHIAIDDFGTGAASLDYLRRLPADRIKIDQSFVRNIGVDPDDEAIVRATIDMAHRLKRAVVAEGVETEQHLQFLQSHHCDELQGYLFCRPLQPVSFAKLLGERQKLLGAREAETA